MTTGRYMPTRTVPSTPRPRSRRSGRRSATVVTLRRAGPRGRGRDAAHGGDEDGHNNEGAQPDGGRGGVRPIAPLQELLDDQGSEDVDLTFPHEMRHQVLTTGGDEYQRAARQHPGPGQRPGHAPEGLPRGGPEV